MEYRENDNFQKKTRFSNRVLKNGQKKCPKMKRGFKNGTFFAKNACGTIMLSFSFFLQKVCYDNFLKKNIFLKKGLRHFGHC